MAGERAAIFGQFIERLSESDIKATDRDEVYKVLLEVLEEFDVRGMDGYLDIDPSFDEVYQEMYPELEDGDD